MGAEVGAGYSVRAAQASIASGGLGGAIRTSEWSDSHRRSYGLNESPSSIGGKTYEKAGTFRMFGRNFGTSGVAFGTVFAHGIFKMFPELVVRNGDWPSCNRCSTAHGAGSRRSSTLCQRFLICDWSLLMNAARLSLPPGFSAGTSFTGSLTWAGQSFASLQLKPGAYVGSLSNAETVTINVVPEPSTCIKALAGLACGGFSTWRRRKRA